MVNKLYVATNDDFYLRIYNMLFFEKKVFCFNSIASFLK